MFHGKGLHSTMLPIHTYLYGMDLNLRGASPSYRHLLPAQSLDHCDTDLQIQRVETWAKAFCNNRADIRGRKTASDR